MSESFEIRKAETLLVGGRQLFGMLHIPVGAGRAPAVLMTHGFAGHKVGSRRLYVHQAEGLARAGIASFRFDFRGCGDSEGHFSDVCVEGLVEDAMAALDYLRAHPSVDPERLGLLGASLGGTISILAAGRNRHIRGLCLWAAVADGKQWQLDWKRLHPEDQDDANIRCTGETAGARFREQFLSTRADHVLKELSDLPLLHFQGGEDAVVLDSHRQLFKEARKGAAAESHFVSLPNSSHQFSHDEERIKLIQETTRWFERTL